MTVKFNIKPYTFYNKVTIICSFFTLFEGKEENIWTERK